jgi:O-antigen/teichoic acid export membrane protein
VSAGGALLVISRISATPGALFRWQAAASLLYVGTMAVMLWRRLPAAPHRARIRPELAAGIWRFAAGMTGIALTGLVLTQVDKIVLSRFAPLDQLGIYAVSSALGSGLYTFISPMFASIFPRLSALVAAHDVAGVRALYRRTWLMAALALIPAAAVLVIFSYDVVRLWTQNPALAASAAPVVALLVTGTALNGLMNVPYALQMAHGWTSVPLRVNIVLALLAVPVAILLVRLYGALGAASVWPAANAIYAVLLLPLTHRHFHAEVEGTWLGREVGPIAVASIAMPWGISQLIPHGQGPAMALVPLAAWAAAVATAMLVCPAARRELQRLGGWP